MGCLFLSSTHPLGAGNEESKVNKGSLTTLVMEAVLPKTAGIATAAEKWNTATHKKY